MSVSVVSDDAGVPAVCRAVEAVRRLRHLPVPGGARPAAGPPRRVLGLHGRDPPSAEVRGRARPLQGSHALPVPRHAQHLLRVPRV